MQYNIHKISNGMQALTSTIYEGTGSPSVQRCLNSLLQGYFLPSLFQNINHHFSPNNSNDHFYTKNKGQHSINVFPRSITKEQFWEQTYFLFGRIARIAMVALEIFTFLNFPVRKAAQLSLTNETLIFFYFFGSKLIFTYLENFREGERTEKTTNWNINWEYYKHLNQKSINIKETLTNQISINESSSCYEPQSLTSADPRTSHIDITLPLDMVMKEIIPLLDDPALRALSGTCKSFFYRHTKQEKMQRLYISPSLTKQEKILFLQKQITPQLKIYLTVEQIENLFKKTEKSKWIGFFPNKSCVKKITKNENGKYHYEKYTDESQMVSNKQLARDGCHWMVKKYSITVFINLKVNNEEVSEANLWIREHKYMSITKFANKKAFYLATPPCPWKFQVNGRSLGSYDDNHQVHMVHINDQLPFID